MKLFANFLIASALVVAVCCRFVPHERNSNSTENSITNSTESITNSTENITNNTEDELERDCVCNWRYFKHYEIKDCVLQQVDSCGCPKKFNCTQSESLQSPAKVCVHRNKEYQVGAKIITSDVCQVCRCRDGVPPFMSCIQKECFKVQPGKDCHDVYEENRCCPVGHQCLTNENDEITSNKTCEYNGELYPFGSKIYPADDPCQICNCDENWNGNDSSSCYQHDCVLERSRSKLDEGCIPVYHENRCCPIEYYCPSSHKYGSSMISNNETEFNETSVGDKCRFGDQFYSMEDQLFINNPCVMCDCLVPPDFTCIHRSCPQSPNDENCYPIYSPEECCPSYECLYGDVPDSGCPTPLCADSSCRIETPPGHECPTCVCGGRVSELEHNDVQQEIQQISQDIEPFQQISQDIEPFQQVYEGPREVADDYSDDELQMMPIRMQDAEGQFSDMERIFLPEAEDVEQYPEEGPRELDDIFSESNSSKETVLASDQFLNEENGLSDTESEMDENYDESNFDHREKVQKRSNGSQVAVPFEQEQTAEIAGSDEGIEREGENTESNGDFADELESFRNKIFEKNETIINEILSIDHLVEVPEGCPTPMCEGPWCKVGIPPGHNCPTCICKRHGGEP